MKGRIYAAGQKCSSCNGTLKHVESRGYTHCPHHPDVKWTGAAVVRFGRNHTKRFKTVQEAERHLIYIRIQSEKDVYDPRDWAINQPLSFKTLRHDFIKIKQRAAITKKQVRHIERVLEAAGKSWDSMHVRDITEGELDDFFNADHGVGNKTLSNWKTVLHDFWVWIVRREKRKSKLQMPDFPDIKYKMEMKTVVSIPDQQTILEEVKRLTYSDNPRIWLGIKLLSLYPRVRPGEMRNVKEGHINLQENWIVFPHPKEGEPKYIHLLPEHATMIKEIRDMAPAMPGMYFFRHLKPIKGVKAGSQLGPKYFNVWWKRACENLGVDGVTVYPGTKHSTVTALGKIMTPEQIKQNVTGHTSDAFERYFLPDHHQNIAATRKVAEMQGELPKQSDIITLKQGNK